MTTIEPKPKRMRRLLRFGIPSLILVTVCAVFLGWYVYRVEQQKAAVRWIEEKGGYFDYDFATQGAQESSDNPNIVGRILGNDYASQIDRVLIGGVDNIEPLRSLPHIEHLSLTGTSITDLSPLSSLSRLKSLEIVRDSTLRDLQPIGSLKNLRQLRIPAAAIGDISVVCGFAQLDVLNITGLISKQDEQRLRESLPDVLIIIDVEYED